MVYCTKCGAKNVDEANNCVSCGAPIQTYRPGKRDWEEEIDRWGEDVGKRAEKFGRRMESECFGIPWGSIGSIVGVLIGVIIILLGARELLGWRIDFGPYVIIVVGILFVAGAIYGLSRRS